MERVSECDSDVFVSSDEVEAFLSYVKTLDYQEKPNYKHLKVLLASVHTGGLDFSVPQEPAGGSTTKPTREKVRQEQLTCVNVLCLIA